MVSHRVGIGTTAMIAAVVLVVVLAASSVVFLLSATGNSSSTGRSSSQSTSTSNSASTNQEFGSSAVFQMLEKNLTLKGEAAVVPCIGFNEASCPSPADAALRPVDLIEYGGTRYYMYNQTEETQCCEVISNATTTTTVPPTFTTYTTWFTNSTVFCISPAHPLTNTEHQNRTCPTEPYHTTAFSIPAPSTSSLSSATGLRLDLALSSNASGGINVAVEEFNMLDHVNNLTGADMWPTDPGNLFLWLQDGCGPPGNFPVGYAIFQGNYSMSNFKTGVPLTLEAQPEVLCPYEAPTHYFAFEPLSDVALMYQWANIAGLAGVYNVTVNTACRWTPGSGCFSSGTGTWSGYWTGSASQAGTSPGATGGDCPGQTTSYGCPLTFKEFPPGVYTAVAADEWGEVALLRFIVANDASTTTTTTGSLSTYTSSGTQEYAAVTGEVSAGPAYPVCQAGKYCNVNMTGYAVGFMEQGTSSADFETLTYNGSFSVELTLGTYLVNLYHCSGTVFPADCAPSCPWLGCSSFYVNNRTLESFPFPISVAGGQTTVLDISIETGIA